MSGFYLLALFALWLFVGWIIYHFWKSRRPENFFQKLVHITIGILLSSAWFGGAFWEVTGKKMYWDAKVRELCAKDGGIKVYETVVLPEDQVDKWGRVLFYQPTEKENALGKEYLFKSETELLRNDDPKVRRFQYQIYRRNDKKLLGMAVSYYRIGGDLPGFWHSSSFGCPQNAGDASLVRKVFVKKK